MDTTIEDPKVAPSITDFVDELVIGLINSRIYWGEHPRVLESIRELETMLPTFAAESEDKVVRLAVAADQFVYQQRPLLGASLSAPRLIQSISDRSSGGLEFDAQASEGDFQKLFDLLALTPPEGMTFREANTQLQKSGCRNIRLLPPYRAEHGKSGVRSLTASKHGGDAGKTKSLVPVELYQSVVNVLQETTVSVCHGGLIKFDECKDSIEGVLRNLEQDAASMFGLTRYERYDAFTFGHSIRVALLALQLARSLTEDKELLNRVGVAALLHDVGKAQVPFEVLHCKTRLDPEQRLAMEKHPVYGAEMLLDHRDCDPLSYTAAFGHHMTPGAHGYPRTLHEQRISLVTAIVKICDVYEALTAVRPYKPAMSSIRAFRIMMSMKGSFHLPLLRRFIDIMGAYPTGTIVRTSDGGVARVREQSSRIELPKIEMLTDPDGAILTEGDRPTHDLCSAAGGGCPTLRVVETLVDAKLEDFTQDATS